MRNQICIQLMWILATAWVQCSSPCCNIEEKDSSRNNWNSVWKSENSGLSKIRLGQEVFKLIFAKEPESRALFKRVNGDDIDSPEFRAHCARVMTAFDTVINQSDNEELVTHFFLHLNMRHARIPAMKPEYVVVMHEAVYTILSQAVTGFDYEAWTHCFTKYGPVIAGHISYLRSQLNQ